MNRYNIIYALWVMLPGSILALLESLVTVCTLGFWCPDLGSLTWMCFALDNFPEWAKEDKNELD